MKFEYTSRNYQKKPKKQESSAPSKTHVNVFLCVLGVGVKGGPESLFGRKKNPLGPPSSMSTASMRLEPRQPRGVNPHLEVDAVLVGWMRFKKCRENVRIDGTEPKKMSEN